MSLTSSSGSDDGASCANLVRHDEARRPARELLQMSMQMYRDSSGARATSRALTGSPVRSPDSQVVDTFRSNALVQPIVEIIRPVDIDSDEYPLAETSQVVKRVVREVLDTGNVSYEIQFEDDLQEIVDFTRLLKLRNGDQALNIFERGEQSPSEPDLDEMVTLRSTRTRTQREAGFVDFTHVDLSSDEGDERGRSKRRTRRSTDSNSGDRLIDEMSSDDSNVESDESASDAREPQRSRRLRRGKTDMHTNKSIRRSSRRLRLAASGREDLSNTDSDDTDLLVSDLVPHSRKRKRASTSKRPSQQRASYDVHANYRRSERGTRAQQNMAEIGEDVLERSGSDSPKPQAPKVVNIQEVFRKLPRGNTFRERHYQTCDTCGNANNSSTDLVYCQGCTLAYHRACLGTRSTRDHLVTKVGDDDFVMQCRRCVNTARNKQDPMAPDMAKCQDCHESGRSCTPFRPRKTPLQEEKEREMNNGIDPIYSIEKQLLNNSYGLLFRCLKCYRGFHYQHLPSRDPYALTSGYSDKELADARFAEYSRDWQCKDCLEMPAKIQTLVAWRPTDPEAYTPGVLAEYMSMDEVEYLVKYDGYSFFQVQWKSGAWVWGVTNSSSRRAFYKKDGGPKMATEDAVPEEYLRIDVVLDVKYTNIIDIRTDEIDRARIKEVDKALIKYKGLSYEEAVWEKVPTSEDGERWSDFVTAYNDWVMGRYIHLPKGKPLAMRLEKMRSTPFTQLEKKKQPENLIGGELMKYQLEGLNWLYYQWYQKKNGILADEMGLGKTIQVIAFLAMLMSDYNCFPFLLVVPNSTCANWRREIKKWAPALRVVTYFGSAAARDIAYRHEMFPEGTSSLRCHVVVTSYEAAADPALRSFFRRVPWQALVVDEGQRLKNDKSLTHQALDNLKVPFRMLLTGTPLQNNARELFNLLHFLDDSIDPEAMEAEYADMDNAKIARLHDLIRPFILRRTKVQVLTFLPPMAQIIVPISMSVLQQKLYKSILAKNPDLLKAIFSTNQLKPAERASLNNVLMQLRKVLCHPFVYSQEIEEKQQNAAVLHRGLVEASSKLQLLELLLPKLRERGHRVLIFSQFLMMLTIVEDFLDGLAMPYQRLDGNTSSLDKQKRIDEFNAPGSPLFAFLLSTRAGGVGINLATADTVIILDPDFNPHQDMQALSRAHRIGQTKKVLCFSLMTRNSAEERIVQIGRKKMALDHVVVDQLDAEDLEEKDVASILRHGAAALFSEGNADSDIKYDEASVDRLLDRSQMENTKAGADKSTDSQFSFARIWANDNSTLSESLGASAADVAPDPSVWDRILKDREKAAAAEAATRAEIFGRGRRARMAVDYSGADTVNVTEAQKESETKESADVVGDKKASAKKDRQRKRAYEDSDTDFMALSSSSESEEEPMKDVVPDTLNDGGPDEPRTPKGLAAPSATDVVGTVITAQPSSQLAQPSAMKVMQTSFKSSARNRQLHGQVVPVQQDPQAGRVQADLITSTTSATLAKPSTTTTKPSKPPVYKFKRAIVAPPRMPSNPLDKTQLQPGATPYPPITHCLACDTSHPKGSCPLKIAGVEHCPLCGLAHYGHARVCPHIKSETQVKLMIDALKRSPEPRHLVDAALRYLRGVKGTLVQAKKIAREKAEAIARGGVPTSASALASPYTYPAATSHAASHLMGLPPVGLQHRPQSSVEDRLFAALGPR